MDSFRKKSPKHPKSTVDQSPKRLKTSTADPNESMLDQPVPEVKSTGQKLERLSHKDKTAKLKSTIPTAGNLGHQTRRVEQKTDLPSKKESILSKPSEHSSTENGHVKQLPKKTISQNKSCVNKPTLKQRSCKDERSPNQSEILSGKEKSHPISNIPHSSGNLAKKSIPSSTDHKNLKNKPPQAISETPLDNSISNDKKVKSSSKHDKKSLVPASKQSNVALEETALKSKTSKPGAKKSESVLEQTKLAFKKIKAALKPNKPSSIPSKSALYQTDSQIKQYELDLLKTRSESELERTEPANEKIIPPNNQTESAFEQNMYVAETVKCEQKLPLLILEQTHSTSKVNEPSIEHNGPTLIQNKSTTEYNIKHPTGPSENVPEDTDSSTNLMKSEKSKIKQTESAIENAYLFLEQTKLALEVSASIYDLSKISSKDAKLVDEQALSSHKLKEQLVEQSQAERAKTESRPAPKSTILKSSKALEESALKSALKAVGKTSFEQFKSEFKENDMAKDPIRSILKQPKQTLYLNELALKQTIPLSDSTKLELENTELAVKDFFKTKALESKETLLKPANFPSEQIELELQMNESTLAQTHTNLSRLCTEKNTSALTLAKNFLQKTESEFGDKIATNHSEIHQIKTKLESRKLEHGKLETTTEILIRPNKSSLEETKPSLEASESTLIPNQPSLEKSLDMKENDWEKEPIKFTLNQDNIIKEPKLSELNLIETRMEQDKLESGPNMTIETKPSESDLNKTESALQLIVSETKPTKSPIEQSKLLLTAHDTPIEKTNLKLLQNDLNSNQIISLVKEQVFISEINKEEQEKSESETNVISKLCKLTLEETKPTIELIESDLKLSNLPVDNTESDMKENDWAIEPTKLFFNQTKPIFEQNKIALNQILYVLQSTKPKQGINDSTSTSANAISKCESALQKILSVLKQTQTTEEQIDLEKENISEIELLYPILKQVIPNFGKITSVPEPIKIEQEKNVLTKNASESALKTAKPAVEPSISTLILNKSNLKQSELQSEGNDTGKHPATLILKQSSTTLEQRQLFYQKVSLTELSNIEHNESATNAKSISSEKTNLAFKQRETALNPLKETESQIKENDPVSAQMNSILNEVKPALEQNESRLRQIQSTSDLINEQQQETKFASYEISKCYELELNKTEIVFEPTMPPPKLTNSFLEEIKSESAENDTSKTPIITVSKENVPNLQQNVLITKIPESISEVTTPDQGINSLALAPINMITESNNLALGKTRSAVKQIENSEEQPDSEQENIDAREQFYRISKKVEPQLKRSGSAQRPRTVTELIKLEQEKTETVTCLVLKPSQSALNQTKLALESNISQSDLSQSPLKLDKCKSSHDTEKIITHSTVNQAAPILEKEQTTVKRRTFVPDPTKTTQEKNNLPQGINKLKLPIAATNMIFHTSQSALEQAILSLELNDWILQPPEFESERTNLTCSQTESAREQTIWSLEQTESKLKEDQPLVKDSDPLNEKTKLQSTIFSKTILDSNKTTSQQTRSTLEQNQLTLYQNERSKLPPESTELTEDQTIDLRLETDELKKILSTSILDQDKTVTEQTIPLLKPLFQQIAPVSDQSYPTLEQIEINLKSKELCMKKSAFKQTESELELTKWALEFTDSVLEMPKKESKQSETVLKQPETESIPSKDTAHLNGPESEQIQSILEQTESEMNPKYQLSKYLLEQSAKLALESNELSLERKKANYEKDKLEDDTKLEQTKSQLELSNKLALESLEPTFEQKIEAEEEIDPSLEQTVFTKTKSSLDLSQPKTKLVDKSHAEPILQDRQSLLKPFECSQELPNSKNIETESKLKALKHPESGSDEESSTLKQIILVSELAGIALKKKISPTEPIEPDLGQTYLATEHIGYAADSIKLTEARFEQSKVSSTCCFPFTNTTEAPDIEEAQLATNQSALVSDQIKTATDKTESVSEQITSELEQSDPAKERTDSKIDLTLALKLTPTRLEQIKVASNYFLQTLDNELEKIRTFSEGTEMSLEEFRPTVKQTTSELEPTKMALELLDSAFEQIKEIVAECKPSLEANKTKTKAEVEIIEKETEQNECAPKLANNQTDLGIEKTKPLLDQMNPVLMLLHVVPNSPRSEKIERVQENMAPSNEQMEIGTLLEPSKLALELIESQMKQTQQTQEEIDAVALQQINMELEETNLAAKDQTMPTQKNIESDREPTNLQSVIELEQIELELQKIESELRLMKLEFASSEYLDESKYSQLTSKNTDTNLEQSETKLKALSALSERIKSSISHINTLVLPLSELEPDKDILESVKIDVEYTEHQLKYYQQELELKKSIQGNTVSLSKESNLAEEQNESPENLGNLEIIITKSSSQQHMEQAVTNQASKQIPMTTEQSEIEMKQPDIELNYKIILQTADAAQEHPLQALDKIEMTLKFQEPVQEISMSKIEQLKPAIEPLNVSLEQIVSEPKQTQPVNVQTTLASATVELELEDTSSFSQTEAQELKSSLGQYERMLEKTIDLETHQPLTSAVFVTNKQESVPINLQNTTSNDNIPHKELRHIRSVEIKPVAEYSSGNALTELMVINKSSRKIMKGATPASYGFEDLSNQMNESYSYEYQEPIELTQKHMSIWEITSSLGEIIKPQLILEHPKNKEFYKSQGLSSSEEIAETVTEYVSMKIEQINASVERFENMLEQCSLEEKPLKEKIEIISEAQTQQDFQATSPSGELIAKEILIQQITKLMPSVKICISKDNMFMPELLTDHDSQKKEKKSLLDQQLSNEKLKVKKDFIETQSQGKFFDSEQEAIKNNVTEQSSLINHEQEQLCSKEMLAELLEKLSVHQFPRSTWEAAEHDGEISDHSSEKEEVPGQISGYDSSKFEGEQQKQKKPKYYDQIAKYLSTQVVKSLVSKKESESQDSACSYNITQKTSSSAAVSLNIVQSITIRSDSKQETGNRNAKNKAFDEIKKVVAPTEALPCLLKEKNKQMSDSICGRDNKESQFISYTRSLKEDIDRKKVSNTIRERKPLSKNQKVEKMMIPPEPVLKKKISSEFKMIHISKHVQTMHYCPNAVETKYSPGFISRSSEFEMMYRSKHVQTINRVTTHSTSMQDNEQYKPLEKLEPSKRYEPRERYESCQQYEPRQKYEPFQRDEPCQRYVPCQSNEPCELASNRKKSKVKTAWRIIKQIGLGLNEQTDDIIRPSVSRGSPYHSLAPELRRYYITRSQSKSCMVQLDDKKPLERLKPITPANTISIGVTAHKSDRWETPNGSKKWSDRLKYRYGLIFAKHNIPPPGCRGDRPLR